MDIFKDFDIDWFYLFYLLKTKYSKIELLYLYKNVLYMKGMKIKVKLNPLNLSLV